MNTNMIKSLRISENADLESEVRNVGHFDYFKKSVKDTKTVKTDCCHVTQI